MGEGIITRRELLTIAEQILKDFQSLISKARPPKEGVNRLRVSLILTIAEQFEATLRLANANMITHAAIHTRSMIEALVAVNMLASESDYVEQMKYEKLRGELRVYTAIIADPNIPSEDKEPIQSRLEECRIKCAEYKSKGCKPKSISNDLGRANVPHLVGPYAMLCSFSHNDLAILALRHEGEISLAYKLDDSPTLVQAVVSTSLMVLMSATNELEKIAKFPEDYFSSVFMPMNHKWGEILDKQIVA